ncbi:hypothetical protein ACMFMG_002653 [Clarireedia jacksonii]
MGTASELYGNGGVGGGECGVICSDGWGIGSMGTTSLDGVVRGPSEGFGAVGGGNFWLGIVDSGEAGGGDVERAEHPVDLGSVLRWARRIGVNHILIIVGGNLM